MAIVNIDERTLVQKIKISILGKEKPKLFRRISVMVGFGVWLYFTIWQTLIFLSILLMERLKNYETIKEAFDRVGAKYAFMHRWGLKTTDVLIYHSIGMFVLFGINLFALILIYRKRKIGHVLYLVSFLLMGLFSYFFLGHKYFTNEISLVDKIIFLIAGLYFTTGIFFFKKPKVGDGN
ncbi:MAG: hypothetical protein ACWA41_12930 [Putridiphycobacter sp.]